MHQILPHATSKSIWKRLSTCSMAKRIMYLETQQTQMLFLQAPWNSLRMHHILTSWQCRQLTSSGPWLAQDMNIVSRHSKRSVGSNFRAWNQFIPYSFSRPLFNHCHLTQGMLKMIRKRNTDTFTAGHWDSDAVVAISKPPNKLNFL